MSSTNGEIYIKCYKNTSRSAGEFFLFYIFFVFVLNFVFYFATFSLNEKTSRRRNTVDNA